MTSAPRDLREDDDLLSPGWHSVIIDGLQQRYFVAGQGPVCVIHSGGPGVDWRYLRMPAVEKFVTAVYVEPLGTGESSRLADRHPDGYTVERYVQALHGLISRITRSDVYLIGHSQGGFIAQRFATLYPERLIGTVLYDTAPVSGPELSKVASRALNEFVERHHNHPEIPGILRAWEGSPTTDDELTAFLRDMLPVYLKDYWGREQEFASLRSSVRGWCISSGDEHFDGRAALTSITTPTLIIVGRDDFICGVSWAEELHLGIAGSDLVILPESGHFGHLEEPEVFARCVETFVNQTGKRE